VRYYPVVDDYVLPNDPEVLAGTVSPGWPRYRAPEHRVMDIGDDSTVRSNAGSSTVEFFTPIVEQTRMEQPAR
jgi:hypothetical protein